MRWRHERRYTGQSPHAFRQYRNTRRALQAIPRWVCWQYETRNGKPTKVPYTTEGRASVTDARSWLPFTNAMSAYELNEQYAGIGFVLSDDDDILGVDLDNVLDERGRPIEMAP